jgi:hypothetical protein
LYDKNYIRNKYKKIPTQALHLMNGYWDAGDTGDTLYNYTFTVKLADIDSTVLLFKDDSRRKAFEWVGLNDTNVFIQRLRDSVVHIKVCKDGGSQFIRYSGTTDKIKTIAPNPSIGNTSITLSMGITGECSVSLIDVFGRVIQEVHYPKLLEGDHSFQFEDSLLETGTYYVVMRTRFAVSSQKISIIK